MAFTLRAATPCKLLLQFVARPDCMDAGAIADKKVRPAAGEQNSIKIFTIKLSPLILHYLLQIAMPQHEDAVTTKIPTTRADEMGLTFNI